MTSVKTNINFIAIIFSIIFQLILFKSTHANNVRGDQHSVSNIECQSNTNGSNCICPGNCLSYDNSTGYCQPQNCWKWDEMKSECVEDGKSFVPAIILQAIPFTGMFGSGFGNMGRWDIFGAYMGLFFGGCLLVCCMTLFCGSNSKDDDSGTKLCSGCGGCLWGLAVTTLYIWGIVVIANKEYEAPWQNWKGESIMCPLVG